MPDPADPTGSAGADSAASPKPPSAARPHAVSHPLFKYGMRAPVDLSVADGFPSPFAAEPDFTASPPLFYAHPSPVEECMARHLTKFPHPRVPEIVGSRVVKDEVDPQTGVRTLTREIKCRNIAPWLFRRFVGGDFVHLTEESSYDPRSREFRLYSENQTYANLVYAKEASRFRPHRENPQWTSFVQYGGIRCNSYMGPAKRPLEKLVCERMMKGGLEAAELLDDLLQSQSPF